MYIQHTFKPSSKPPEQLWGHRSGTSGKNVRRHGWTDSGGFNSLHNKNWLMDLLKNNTSLKKYFRIIKTSSTEHHVAFLPGKGSEHCWLQAAAATLPRDPVTEAQQLPGRGQDTLWREGRMNRTPPCMWHNPSLHPKYFYLISSALCHAHAGLRSSHIKVTEDGQDWFGTRLCSTCEFFLCDKQSVVDVLHWQNHVHRTKNI